MKIISVVGARPNFMKISPFIKEINKHHYINHKLIHTGQHYDDRMSRSFFETLEIPFADINLEIGSGTHAEQIGMTMIKFEKVLKKENPDWVVVVGDVNATLACSIVAKKLNIKVCHIEAGLRSKDKTMPEEINRLVTDRLSDLLLTPDRISSDNLIKEGISSSKIKFVGNIMIDTLENNIEKIRTINVQNIIAENLLENQIDTNFKDLDYFALITMHRPSNVDSRLVLEPIIELLLNDSMVDFPIIWPVHPRTEKQLKDFNLWVRILNSEKIILLHPLNYHDMLRLNKECKIMFTDSGGLQEECTVLGTPCITLRENTERPITLLDNGGVSLLVGNNVKNIQNGYDKIINIKHASCRPELWDGKTAYRCLKEILDYS
ncbi:MAG: UDP-N-acetylglucosamine 2-epimerase (non-hydrolyzing) [Candidatus Marinimicrobia bacterium]|nr:UDP-N-acetylglucosamine 2-epimerase (non-hydrolyzing) [Candidatus Neomarinimicrobiota bacterium]|tara:strand:+ start:45561 stop:46694 length:1134 start_codon:yes stop_codon:yes gene_type:complete